MHTRHWIFGIGLPIMGAAQAAIMGFATPDETAMTQAAQAQFSIWISMAVQVGIGIVDWIKNNNKAVKVNAQVTIKVNVDKRIVAPGQKLYIHVTSPDRVGNNPMSITLGSLSIGSFTSDPTGNMFACIIVPSLPPGVQSLFVTSQLEGNASTGMTIVTTPTTGTQSCAIIGYNAPTFTKGQDGAFLPMSLKLYNNSDVQGTFRVGFVGRFSSAQSLAQDFSVPANSSFVYASARINSYDSVRVVITALNVNTPTTTSPTQIIYLPITQGNSTTPIPIYQTGGDVPPIGNEPPPPPDAGSSFPWWLLLVGVLAGVASRGRGKKQTKKAGRYR